MNVRWLWLNHVPLGLTLTTAERERVVRLAKQKRARGPLIRRRDWLTRLRFVAVLLTLTLVFTLWILYLPRMGFNTAGVVVSNVGGILTFNALMWVCIAWFTHRTNAPYVRWAMWEIGKPVCVNCGYILTAAIDPMQPCPECGARHEATVAGNQHSTDSGDEISQIIHDYHGVGFRRKRAASWLKQR